jgi:hypothetical protein
MSHTAILITSADAAFFKLAQHTSLSLRANSPRGFSCRLGFLDTGCAPEQLAWLREYVDVIRIAEWVFDFPSRSEAPRYLQGLLARPRLRECFPDYDLYFWIDADACVLDARAVELFLQGAQKRGLAIVPEVDRGNKIQYGGLPAYWQFNCDLFCQVFGDNAALNYHSYPLLNAGVFALHHQAPHWRVWECLLSEGLQKSATMMTDQVALNLAVYDGLFDHAEFLPAWCNWTYRSGPPVWDSLQGCLVEPYLPHTPIGILHLTGQAKPEDAQLRTTDGGAVSVRLRYPPCPLASSASYSTAHSSSEHDYVSPGWASVDAFSHFPCMAVGEKNHCTWPYLRRGVPHRWFVDTRFPFVGFLNLDEVHILYNTAQQFRGRRALEIGCWMGWSACHLALAGVQLDVIDPLLGRSDIHDCVSNSLQQAGILERVRLVAGNSPGMVHELADKEKQKWSLFFIDGEHGGMAPLLDAAVCDAYAEDDAAMLFHDLASPYVTQAVLYLKQRGWQTRLYQTMQVMAVAWRGRVVPLHHQPDLSVAWDVPEHLRSLVNSIQGSASRPPEC